MGQASPIGSVKTLFCPLRRRVLTRLAWMGISQGEFADVIQMDRSLFSRVLRAGTPHQSTILRISRGLGIDSIYLSDPCSDIAPLLIEHEAFRIHPSEERRFDRFRAWFDAMEAKRSSPKKKRTRS